MPFVVLNAAFTLIFFLLPLEHFVDQLRLSELLWITPLGLVAMVLPVVMYLMRVTARRTFFVEGESRFFYQGDKELLSMDLGDIKAIG